MLPECIEYAKGHPICGLPSASCIFVRPDRLTEKHGDDWLTNLVWEELRKRTVRVMRACKWHVYIVINSAHKIHLKPLLVPKEGDYQPTTRMIGKLL